MRITNMTKLALTTLFTLAVPGVESLSFSESFMGLFKVGADTVKDAQAVIDEEVTKQKRLQETCTAYSEYASRCPKHSVALVAGSPEYNALGFCNLAGCFRANQTGASVTMETAVEMQVAKLPTSDQAKGLSSYLKAEANKLKKETKLCMKDIYAALHRGDFVTLGIYLSQAQFKGYHGRVLATAQVKMAKHHALQRLESEIWYAQEFGVSSRLGELLEDKNMMALVDDVQLVGESWKLMAATLANEISTNDDRMDQLKQETLAVKSDLSTTSAELVTTSADLTITTATLGAAERALTERARDHYHVKQDALEAFAALEHTFAELNAATGKLNTLEAESTSKLDAAAGKLTTLEVEVVDLHDDLAKERDTVKAVTSMRDTCLEALSMEQSDLLRTPDGGPNEKFYQAFTQFYVTLPREVINSLDELTRANGGSLPSWTEVFGVVVSDGMANTAWPLFVMSVITGSGFALVFGAVFLLVRAVALIVRVVVGVAEYLGRQLSRLTKGLGRLLKRMGVSMVEMAVAGVRFLPQRVRR